MFAFYSNLFSNPVFHYAFYTKPPFCQVTFTSGMWPVWILNGQEPILIHFQTVGTSVNQKRRQPYVTTKSEFPIGQSLTWFNFQSMFKGHSFCTNCPKTVLKMCVAIRTNSRVLNVPEKHLWWLVLLEVVAWTRVAKADVNGVLQ